MTESARWLSKISHRLRSLFSREASDADLSDELRDHLAQKTHLYVSQGLSPLEASRRAQLDFGGIAKRTEECRDARNVTWIETFLADAKFGLRILHRAPGFSLVAIVTLALGIGANTAIFSVVNNIVLRPLPYPEANRVVEINFDDGGGAFENDADAPQYIFWRNRSETLDSVAAIFGSMGGFNLSGDSGPVHVSGLKVSREFFPAIGMQAILGRGFTREEDSPNGPSVAVLSYGLWRSAFGGDPNITNRTIIVNGAQQRVVGVLPPGFRLESMQRSGTDPDVFLPLQMSDAVTGSGANYTTIARLKPGVTLSAANADATRLASEYQREHPGSSYRAGASMRAEVRPLHSAMVEDSGVTPKLWVLMGAVAFVLLIACVNVANLFLSRAATRRREIAVRAALGATAKRIFSQLIAESLVFAFLSAILGVAIAFAGTRILAAISPQSLPPIGAFEFDWRVLGFTLALSLVVASITGSAAALYALRADVNESIKSGGEQQGSRLGRAVPRVLIATEVALSLVLLAGATLLAGTVVRLYRVPLGFNSANLTSASVSLAGERYNKSASVADFQRRAAEALSAVPGVVSVAGASSTPLERGLNTVVFPKGAMSNDGSDMLNIEFRAVTPQYFRTIGIPLTSGRDFSSADAAGAAPVMIVNQALAKLIWPQDSSAPIGKPLLIGEGGPKTPPRSVVGVVADIREAGVDRPVRATVYVPQAQLSDEFTQMTNYWFASSLFVRTAPGVDVTNEIRRVVAAVDPELPVARAESLRRVLDDSIGDSRFLMLLMAGFAALALLLACVGIYAVLSFQISRRTREIGIRVALGASRKEVLRLVLGEGTRPAFAGIVVGLAAAFALSRLLEGMLFGVRAHDPLVYAAVAAALACVAALASWIPARRALRVDPIIALRHN